MSSFPITKRHVVKSHRELNETKGLQITNKSGSKETKRKHRDNRDLHFLSHLLMGSVGNRICFLAVSAGTAKARLGGQASTLPGRADCYVVV
jgi:hypothetical protein